MTAGASRQLAEESPVVKADILKPEETHSAAIATSIRDAKNSGISTPPTLRRVALLNTLVFLGLALSHSEIHAHKSTSASALSRQPTKNSNQNNGNNEHLQNDASSVAAFVGAASDVFQSSSTGDMDPSVTYQQLQNLFEEDEKQQNILESEEPENDYIEDAFDESSSSSGTSSQKDIIIVATVDGTMAAIDSSSGKVLWKQAGEGSKEHYHQGYGEVDNNNHDGMKLPHLKESENGKSGSDRLLQPLIATSTTAKSSRQSASTDSSKTVAIPSIDGSVYLTTPASHAKDGGTRPTDSSLTTTITSSLRELVSRAPYVDANGRFYVGSRHATAAAVDGDTGEILHVASADGNDERNNNKSDPMWEGRNVVWIGRVDYSVSVYNARTSAKEVQFSAAEIMSVNDMIEGSGKATSKTSHLHNYQEALSSTSERAPNLMLSHEEQVFENSVYAEVTPSMRQFSELVSTPSGNLAYRNPQTGQVEWVADQIFETPIAYAIRSSSGSSLNIDIIPDVTMPSESKEYLAKEMERQIEVTLNDGSIRSNAHGSRESLQPPVVGTLLSGQLYAMPLGKRKSTFSSRTSAGEAESSWAETHHTALGAAAVHQHHSAASSSSSASFGSKYGVPKKPPVIGTNNRIGNGQDERQVVGAMQSKICAPSSHNFPGCLFKAVSQLSADQSQSGNSESTQIQTLHNMDASAVSEYIAQYSYSQQYAYQHNYDPTQHRQRNYRKILRILGSWLPPTIALIFVVSFELGRRKRQKDIHDETKQLDENNVLVCNDLLKAMDEPGCDTKDFSSRQVIQITDQVLGYGGHGTVVFKGTLEGRNVAVKRMLKTYLASADREISLLIESDGHPNVVRYFLKEVKGDFVYLALELCDLSLHNLIGTLAGIQQDPDEINPSSKEHCISLATKKLILQIANGVKHLHSLRIVHNDLKPANILLAVAKEAKLCENGASNESIVRVYQQGRYVAKISDMGLGKMLAGQSSFGGTLGDISNRQLSVGNSHSNVGIGPGTVGWMAPEAMRVKSRTALSTDISVIGNSAEASPIDRSSTTLSRASRSVDIFSLGCIFYSTLVPGSHPFGEWYEREANIMHNQPNIEALKSLSIEAYDLVSAMIQHNPRNRPTAKQICEHPFFWSLQQKLSFVCDLSDRLETDAALCGNDSTLSSSSFVAHPLAIESNATSVVGLAWDKVLYKDLISNVQRYRAYDPCSVRDLLRLIRNKHHHYDELPPEVRQRIGTNTEGLMKYFESCFPLLLLHCYKVCSEILSPDDPLVEKYSISTIGKQSSKQVSGKAGTSTIGNKATSGNVSLPLVTKETTQTAESSPVEETLINSDESQDVASADSFERVSAGSSFEDPGGPEATSPSQEIVEVEKSPQEEAIARSPAGPILQSPVDSAQRPIVDEQIQNDIVLWEGSTAARAFNCRGWIRSDDEWTRRIVGSKKRNANLVRSAEDLKFRTRLCNHWDVSLGTLCPMRRKNKCVFAHGPVELRVKDGKRHRWGKLVDKNGNNSNPNHSGGEDTYGAARSIESARKEEGKWNTDTKGASKTKKQGTGKKKQKFAANNLSTETPAPEITP